MARAPVTFEIPSASFVKRCNSCGAAIVWIETAAGKRMPVDYAVGATHGTSHFATCPDAATWRKGKT
jgi:hypothetical protein